MTDGVTPFLSEVLPDLANVGQWSSEDTKKTFTDFGLKCSAEHFDLLLQDKTGILDVNDKKGFIRVQTLLFAFVGKGRLDELRKAVEEIPSLDLNGFIAPRTLRTIGQSETMSLGQYLFLRACEKLQVSCASFFLEQGVEIPPSAEQIVQSLSGEGEGKKGNGKVTQIADLIRLHPATERSLPSTSPDTAGEQAASSETILPEVEKKDLPSSPEKKEEPRQKEGESPAEENEMAVFSEKNDAGVSEKGKKEVYAKTEGEMDVRAGQADNEKETAVIVEGTEEPPLSHDKHGDQVTQPPPILDASTLAIPPDSSDSAGQIHIHMDLPVSSTQCRQQAATPPAPPGGGGGLLALTNEAESEEKEEKEDEEEDDSSKPPSPSLVATGVAAVAALVPGASPGSESNSAPVSPSPTPQKTTPQRESAREGPPETPSPPTPEKTNTHQQQQEHPSDLSPEKRKEGGTSHEMSEGQTEKPKNGEKKEGEDQKQKEKGSGDLPFAEGHRMALCSFEEEADDEEETKEQEGTERVGEKQKSGREEEKSKVTMSSAASVPNSRGPLSLLRGRGQQNKNKKEEKEILKSPKRPSPGFIRDLMTSSMGVQRDLESLCFVKGPELDLLVFSAVAKGTTNELQYLVDVLEFSLTATPPSTNDEQNALQWKRSASMLLAATRFDRRELVTWLLERVRVSLDATQPDWSSACCDISIAGPGLRGPLTLGAAALCVAALHRSAQVLPLLLRKRGEKAPLDCDSIVSFLTGNAQVFLEGRCRDLGVLWACPRRTSDHLSSNESRSESAWSSQGGSANVGLGGPGGETDRERDDYEKDVDAQSARRSGLEGHGDCEEVSAVVMTPERPQGTGGGNLVQQREHDIGRNSEGGGGHL